MFVVGEFKTTERYVYKVDESSGHHRFLCPVTDLRAAADALTALADEVEKAREGRVVDVSDRVRIICTPTCQQVETRQSVGYAFGPALPNFASEILAAYDAGKAARDE